MATKKEETKVKAAPVKAKAVKAEPKPKATKAAKKESISDDVKAGSKTSIDVENYLSCGTHIGTKVKTKDMSKFVYKTNPNGLHIIDVQVVDERIKKAGNFLAKYNPDEIVLVSRRENGWKPVKAFGKAIGAKYYVGRYPAGVLTNPSLKTFVEPSVMVVTDPWTDKNAVHDAMLAGIPIVALCDTNNTLQNIDVAVPCNNKGGKSLGLVYWLLANYYLQARKELKGKKLDKAKFIPQ